MINWDMLSLRKHVARCENKDEKYLRKAALEWLKASTKNKIDYEVEWFGIPVIQTPADMVLMQELIFKAKPDFVIETGIAHGGGLIFYASLLELLGKGRVIGIDIDFRKHNRKVIEAHPLFKRIKIIQGDSTSDEVMEAIRVFVKKESRAIVCLDSNHHRKHVLKELLLYKQFVNVGSYIVVFDTITSTLVKSGVCGENYRKNGPMEAISDFLKKNRDFIIDKDFNKLYISTSPNGYLKRIK
ncbi:MAG: CmcI family methyltransferase [Candidatus Omnitrophica bacterium]|nr:CmcI family methyltransferase [Candidatus Omnitrophota bacterium]MDD5591869.1 CmcI family methyltransferase [Candidatus Omnitrophota bacterium]